MDFGIGALLLLCLIIRLTVPRIRNKRLEFEITKEVADRELRERMANEDRNHRERMAAEDRKLELEKHMASLLPTEKIVEVFKRLVPLAITAHGSVSEPTMSASGSPSNNLNDIANTPAVGDHPETVVALPTHHPSSTEGVIIPTNQRRTSSSIRVDTKRKRTEAPMPTVTWLQSAPIDHWNNSCCVTQLLWRECHTDVDVRSDLMENDVPVDFLVAVMQARCAVHHPSGVRTRLLSGLIFILFLFWRGGFI